MERAKVNLIITAILITLIATGSAWADLSDGLVAHWKLDGDAIDSAGTNHGTIYGATPTTGVIDGAVLSKATLEASVTDETSDAVFPTRS